jgi:hypothetical protein
MLRIICFSCLVFCLLVCKAQPTQTKNVYLDSLILSLEKNAILDTTRVITMHKISYRLSEIHSGRSWKYAKETETLAKQLQFPKGECLANINYAILEAMQGNFERSTDYYMKAIKIAELIHFKRGISIAYNNMGENSSKMKDAKNAIAYTEKAFDINKEIKELRGMAINKELIGSVYFEQKQFGSAMQQWSEGFEYALQSKDPNVLSQLHVDMAKYYIETNQLKNAFQRLHIADSISSSRYEILYQLFTYKAFSKAYDKLLKPDSSYSYLQRALQGSRILGNKNEECDIYQLLAAHFEKQKQYDSGIHYLRKYKALSDTVLSEKNFAHVAFIQTQYETELKDRENLQLKNIQSSQKKEIKEKNYLLLASAIALLMAFLSLFLLYRSFLNKKHNLELLEQKNVSEYKQQVTELEIKSLRSQMNPHFIFNSLNSIRNYIIKNEPHLASNYLAQFATLMRKILDASAQNFIYMEDEIDMLKLYLELELMRFNQRFSYTIDIDETVEQANYKIPSMVLQPFIENAIWHGLLNKEDGIGKLSISFVEVENNEDQILCTITDNGIGRVKSASFKNELKQHKSKGLEITKDRLIRLSNHEIMEPIKFEDLYDKQGIACGTKVNIYLPVS